MPQPVFISYARNASSADAQALANRLDNLAFFDRAAIDDGDHFPQRLLDGVLDAQVVVIFATNSYLEWRFCRLEMRLALAGGDAAATQIVMALGKGASAVLDVMPPDVATGSWPGASETDRLEALVLKRLKIASGRVRDRMGTNEARRLAEAFFGEAKVPQPQSLDGIVCAIPEGVAAQSIGTRFVGRADDLREIHRALSEGSGGAAQLTSRIAAGAGFGKTRLAVEYLHRFGPTYYPGGLFWVDGGSKALDVEFHRVLRALDPAVPHLAALRAEDRDVRYELERALRGIGRAALYVVDNVPEPAPGTDPPSIGEFCPALGAVTVLATSRQDTREANVRAIPVDALTPEAATLLLTETVLGAGVLTWKEWERVAGWVGYLPLALDLLNRSLLLQSISARDLLKRATTVEPRTEQLDRLREALRGQVPKDAVRGITEAFSISFEKLDEPERQLAFVLAQLAPAPIPEEFMNALPEGLNSPGTRVALRSRHFVTSGGGSSFGAMHQLTADFLRCMTLSSHSFETVINSLSKVMTADRCRDPRQWPLMNLCRPHAEELFARGVDVDPTAAQSSLMEALSSILALEQGDYAGARHLEQRVLEVRRRVLGKEHPDTLTSMANLANTLAARGEYAGALQLGEQVLEVRRRVLGRVLGEDHPDTLSSMADLARTLAAQRDYAGARQLQERVLEAGKRVLGEEHPDTLTSMANLARTLSNQGDYAGARQLEERVLEVRKRVLGEEHPHTLATMSNLALTLSHHEDYAGARQLQERVLEVRRRVLGKEHPDTLRSMNNLGDTLFAQGDHDGALRHWNFQPR